MTFTVKALIVCVVITCVTFVLFGQQQQQQVKMTPQEFNAISFEQTTLYAIQAIENHYSAHARLIPNVPINEYVKTVTRTAKIIALSAKRPLVTSIPDSVKSNGK